MSSVFIIDNTDGTLSLTMAPGSLNGPGSGTRDTDLRIYGKGALLWGEGVNENILRSAENFACSAKVTGDFLSGTDDPNTYVPGTPGNGSYVTGTHPDQPQDEYDLGPSKGITFPLQGQLWYNKTNSKMYAYTGTDWIRTSAVLADSTQPITAVSGELWFDTGTGNPCLNPQLKIYDGANWVSVAHYYLSTCGGTMSGDIDMDTYSLLNVAMPAGTAATDGANRGYVDTAAATAASNLAAHASTTNLHINANERTFLNALNSNVGGDIQLTTGADLAKMDGYNASGLGDVQAEMQNRIRKNATDTMTAGQTIVLGKNPTAGTLQAATAQYVDNEIATASGASGGVRNIRFWSSQSPSASEGDITISGANAYMFVNGSWVQIYPAQYTS